MRRRALKKVQKLVESLENDQDNLNYDRNVEVGLNIEESGGFEEMHTYSEEESELSPTVEAEHRFDDSDEMDMDRTDTCSESTSDLRASLADWAIEFGMMALSALLSILKLHHPFLPKDGRTLLRTKTTYKIETLAGGILNAFHRILDNEWSVLPDRHTFRLQLNFDGLPLFKSTGTQFWPILGMLQGYSKNPVVIGLFCGNSKPNSLSEYLQRLVNELKMLRSGFVCRGKTFFLNISSVVCDTPVRAFIRAVKSHTAYHGCDKCHQSGVRIGSRMTFPEVSARRRTDKCPLMRTTTMNAHLSPTLILTWLPPSLMIKCTWCAWG